MSRMKDLATDALNDLHEIAADTEALVERIRAHHATYVAPFLDEAQRAELEKAPNRRLYVNRGIVSLLEVGAEELRVELR